MKRALIRSNIFNLAFYGWTALACLIFLPGLLLPRRYFLWIVTAWIGGATFLEKNILNLHHEIRGQQCLPRNGPYIAACKHQSPYETIKLRVLFKDPAIVLKKELLSIPFWGWFLNKSDVIAIDRSTPDQAYISFEQGALRMKNQGRPIVIFPQGTRVWPHETPAEKPYRSGVARVQASTGLPIIPMALNSGMFWPRTGWLKSPGTVVFEFLEPIPPGGDKEATMHDLQTRLETASNELTQEALTRPAPKNRAPIYIAALLAILFAGYSWLWFKAAEKIEIAYYQITSGIGGPGRLHTSPVITGYPGPVRVMIEKDFLQTANGTFEMRNVVLTGWPAPFLPIHLTAENVLLRSNDWKNPLPFHGLDAWFTWSGRKVKIKESTVKNGAFTAHVTGDIDISVEPVPDFDLMAELENYQEFLMTLATLEIIKPKDVFLTAAALGLFSQNGIAKIPVTQKNSSLFVGPLQVGSLPELRRQAPGNPPDPAQ